MKDKWNLLCRTINKIPEGSSEAQYQEEIEYSLIKTCLGWAKDKDFFSQYTVQIGATPGKADIVIKKDDNVVIVIEIKLPTAPTRDKAKNQLCNVSSTQSIENRRTRDKAKNQLCGYMRNISPLPANFGILIGNSLEFFYDNITEKIAMQLIFEVDFEEDNEVGILFLELFNKSTFDVDKLHKFCKQKIKDLEIEKQTKEIERQAQEEVEKLLADGAKIIIDDFHNCLSEKYPENIAKILKDRIDITIRQKINGTIDPVPPPPIDTEEEEINKVRRKVPKWFQNPHQINSKILIAFMQLLKDNDPVSRNELRKKCYSVEKFNVSFPQMVHVGKKANAKVFNVTKDDVRLWKQVAQFIIDEWNKHPELH